MNSPFEIGFFAPLDDAFARLLEFVCFVLRCRTGVRLALSFFGVVFNADGDISFASGVTVAFCGAGLGGSITSAGAGNGTFRGRPRFFTSVDSERLRRVFALVLLSPSSSLLSLNVGFSLGCFRFRRVDDILLVPLSLFSSSK